MQVKNTKSFILRYYRKACPKNIIIPVETLPSHRESLIILPEEQQGKQIKNTP